jgi:hypothetical protein
MSRSKLFITSISLLVLFTVKSTFAFVPVLIPAWIYGTTAALAVTGAAAGLYYGMKTGVSTKTSATGDLYRNSEAAYAIATASGAAALKEDGITAKMLFDTAKAISAKLNTDNSNKYPLTKAAMTKTVGSDGPQLTNQVGDIISTNVGYKQITSRTTATSVNYPPDYGRVSQDSTQALVLGGANSGGVGLMLRVTLRWGTGTAVPATRPSTSDEFSKTVTGSSTPLVQSTPVSATYQAELDKMFQDPDYVPVFTDDTTGLLYTPPTGVLTMAQLEAANLVGTASDDRTAAVAAAVAAEATAQTARDNALASKNAAQTAAAANPTDQTLADKLTAAIEKLAAAELALSNAKTTTKTTTATASTTAATDAAATSVTAPTLSAYGTGDFDFAARFTAFINTMKTTGIFSIPTTMLNMPSGGSSVFNLSFGRFGSYTYDLSSQLGSGLAIFRFLCLAMCTIAAIKIVTLKGGGG